MANIVENKVAVVTGAGQGIGRTLAMQLAAHGAKVVVNDIGTESDEAGQKVSLAQRVVEEIIQVGGQAVASTASVAQPEGAEAIIATALETFGGLDVVVNNAGILRDKIFYRMSYEDWDQVIKVNLSGSFYVARAAADHFKEQQGGSYIHFTSGAGLIGKVGQANYSAAKLGMVALSNSIARDMAKYNVRSNCIAPQAWTRMFAGIPDRPETHELIQKNKMCKSEKIGPLVVYLASDLAKEVTGQIFGVRRNEIYLFSQNRPIRFVHRSEGWTPQTVAEHAMPALKASFYKLDMPTDVMAWDPI